jgi:hypothetical protein
MCNSITLNLAQDTRVGEPSDALIRMARERHWEIFELLLYVRLAASQERQLQQDRLKAEA